MKKTTTTFVSGLKAKVHYGTRKELSELEEKIHDFRINFQIYGKGSFDITYGNEVVEFNPTKGSQITAISSIGGEILSANQSGYLARIGEQRYFIRIDHYDYN